MVDRTKNTESWKAVKGFFGWPRQRQRQKRMWSDQRGDTDRWVTISKIAVLFESWYVHGGRNDGCVRAHGNPGPGFSTNVCAFRKPTSALTKFLTNTDVEILEWGKSEPILECGT